MKKKVPFNKIRYISRSQPKINSKKTNLKNFYFVNVDFQQKRYRKSDMKNPIKAKFIIKTLKNRAKTL